MSDHLQGQEVNRINETQRAGAPGSGSVFADFLANDVWGKKAAEKSMGTFEQVVRSADDALAGGKSKFGVEAGQLAMVAPKAIEAPATDKPKKLAPEANIHNDGSIEFTAWLDSKTRIQQQAA